MRKSISRHVYKGKYLATLGTNLNVKTEDTIVSPAIKTRMLADGVKHPTKMIS
jgi:hypothetical protein